VNGTTAEIIAFFKENQFLLRHFAKLNIVSYAGFYNPTALKLVRSNRLTQEWRVMLRTQNIIIPDAG
jgi:hypothetical protein